MTQAMQPDYSQLSQRPRTSGAAVASLILGILGCIPIVTGFLAVILGIVGIRSTSKPNVGGRGLAIAGLILGLLSVIGWASFGGIFAWGWHVTAPSRIECRAFLQDLSDGNVDQAQTLCDSSVSRSDLDTLAEQIKNWGPLKGVTFFSFNAQTSPGQSSQIVGGSATFQGGPKSATFTLTHTSQGWKIQKWDVK